MFPLKTKYTIGYRHGDKTFYNASHIGVDLIVPEMTPIYAPQDGTVTHLFGVQGGQWVILTSSTGKHRFAHIKQYNASQGQSVRAGDIIAYSGGKKGEKYSGNSTNPHVHWDYNNGAFVDPMLENWEEDLMSQVNSTFRKYWKRQPLPKESKYFQKRIALGTIKDLNDLNSKMSFWYAMPRFLFILEMQKLHIY